MSREIKFRAWNSIDKCMCDNSTTLTNLRGFIKSKHYHPMQYTGLKDRNGVEIYEGDIVLLGSDKKEWEIVYCKLTQCPSAKLLFKYGMNIYTFDELHRDDLLDKVKVIGNIHQNPELLK